MAELGHAYHGMSVVLVGFRFFVKKPDIRQEADTVL